MDRVLGACVLLLALTGCVQSTHPPDGGLSDEESAELALEFAEGVYGDELPDGFTVTLVEPMELGDAIVGCLKERGFEGYTGIAGGVLWDGDSMSESEGQAWTLCSTMWQVDPAATGQLNAQQLGYLYDYYRESTVPCLAMAGIELPDAPTRQQFIDSGGDWQPVLPSSDTYVGGGFDLGQSPWMRSTPDSDPAARCPIWPPEWQL